jgi:hypothetical protein
MHTFCLSILIICVIWAEDYNGGRALCAWAMECLEEKEALPLPWLRTTDTHVHRTAPQGIISATGRARPLHVGTKLLLSTGNTCWQLGRNSVSCLHKRTALAPWDMDFSRCRLDRKIAVYNQLDLILTVLGDTRALATRISTNFNDKFESRN